MHIALIRVIDQTRMLDQDLIRLQQKVDVVLEYRENEKKKSGKNTNEKSKLILSCILSLGVNADEIKFGLKIQVSQEWELVLIILQLKTKSSKKANRRCT